MTRDDMTLRIARLESQLLAANEAAEQRRQAIEHMDMAVQMERANHARHVQALREGLHVALEALQRLRDGQGRPGDCGAAIDAVREALSYE